MSNYDDIINHPHYVHPLRTPMSMHDRAAQFSPFAALVGFDAQVEETGRLTEDKIILDENEFEKINRTIGSLQKGDSVTITYFVPDLFKSGGLYLPVSGMVKKIDDVEGKLILTDESVIPFGDILMIEKET